MLRRRRVDLLVEHGVKKQAWELRRVGGGAETGLAGSAQGASGGAADAWRSAWRRRAGSCDGLELQRESPTRPCRRCSRTSRARVVERVDQERYALKQRWRKFRRAVRHAARAGCRHPAQFRDRSRALTRQVLDTAIGVGDRRGITSRKGDTGFCVLDRKVRRFLRFLGIKSTSRPVPNKESV